MKHLKLFGLLAVAAAALLAFAASATATTVTDSAGGTTPTFHWLSEDSPSTSGVHMLTHNEVADIECNSTAEGKIESHGSGVTAKGNLSALSFSSCTGGWAVTVLNKGSLEFHTTSTSGHGTATLTWNGAKLRWCFFGCNFVECVYETNNTDIGTVTGGNPATLHLSAAIPFVEGDPICGEEQTFWTGAYTTTGTLKFDV